MFVQISPLEQDLGETLSSLNFATRVRGVELGPAKKQIDFGEIQKLKLLVSFIVFTQFFRKFFNSIYLFPYSRL